MFKGLVKKVALSWIRNSIGTTASVFGVFLIENGATTADTELLTSAAVVAVMFIWSFIEKYVEAKKEHDTNVQKTITNTSVGWYTDTR